MFAITVTLHRRAWGTRFGRVQFFDFVRLRNSSKCLTAYVGELPVLGVRHL